MNGQRRAQVVLFAGFDPLDVIGPFEVLVAGGLLSGGALAVELVAAEGPGEVRSGVGGLVLRATAVLDPTADVLVVPGAAGPVQPPPGDPDADTIPVLLARTLDTPLPSLLATALAARDTLVATVCGGSLVLAMAGLIEGRHAVTHRQGMDLLAATGVAAVAARVVEDLDLVSAGGVTSGLDLGLYLLDRLLGPRIAHAVEELFEFERRGVIWRAHGPVPVAL